MASPSSAARHVYVQSLVKWFKPMAHQAFYQLIALNVRLSVFAQEFKYDKSSLFSISYK